MSACEIAFKWISQNIFNDKWTLAQAMAWLESVKHKAIAWANVDLDLRCESHQKIPLSQTEKNMKCNLLKLYLC